MNEKIRNISICLIHRDRDIFVFEGFDSVKGETFYRPLGGGIEFGETAEEAAIREIQEEMDTVIENVSYLTTFENIFTLEGQPGHEIVMLMAASFKDKSFYARNNISCNENGATFVSMWVGVDEFISGRKILYPKGLREFLTQTFLQSN